jgi:ubiquinone/menaquinone biosynthesis C-methylase UbiE
VSRTAIPVSVEEGYERWAATYDRDPNPLLAREERHLIPRIARLSASRPLDLACGTGRWLGHMNERGTSGVGVDNSAAMLNVARKNLFACNQLVQADCECLPLRDSAFDFAICSFAVGHVADVGSVAAELGRVLQPGSNVFISDLHPFAFAHGWRVGLRDNDEALEIASYAHTGNDVIRSFESKGFECLSDETLWLGEPEKIIFECAGRSTYFSEACDIPAVIVFHFRQTDPSFEPRMGKGPS